MPNDLTPASPEVLRQDAGESPGGPARVELLLETHRVIGIIDQPGPPRRLVDVLNAIDGPVAVVRDGLVENLAHLNGEAQRFGLLQVNREAILLAIPVSNGPPPPRSREVVEKRPVVATLVLPGLQITGHVYLPPQADSGTLRLLGRDGFLPVTDAEVTQVAFGLCQRREPLVVVNLSTTILCALAAPHS